MKDKTRKQTSREAETRRQDMAEARKLRPEQTASEVEYHDVDDIVWQAVPEGRKEGISFAHPYLYSRIGTIIRGQL